MSLSILNNIPSLAAQNNLQTNNANLQRTAFRLSSGSRINSGADDAAGLAIADGLHANITALNQSAQKREWTASANCKTADGGLAQVTSLLTAQSHPGDASLPPARWAAASARPWMQSSRRIKAEIDRIGRQHHLQRNVVLFSPPRPPSS